MIEVSPQCFLALQINLDVPSKRVVYKLYWDFMEVKGFSPEQMLSCRAFRKLWSGDFPHLKTSKRQTSLFKCTVCEYLKVRFTLITILCWLSADVPTVLILYRKHLLKRKIRPTSVVFASFRWSILSSSKTRGTATITGVTWLVMIRKTSHR